VCVCARACVGVCVYVQCPHLTIFGGPTVQADKMNY